MLQFVFLLHFAQQKCGKWRYESPSILKIRIAIVCYFVYCIPFMINCTVLIYKERERALLQEIIINNQRGKES